MIQNKKGIGVEAGRHGTLERVNPTQQSREGSPDDKRCPGRTVWQQTQKKPHPESSRKLRKRVSNRETAEGYVETPIGFGKEFVMSW